MTEADLIAACAQASDFSVEFNANVYFAVLYAALSLATIAYGVWLYLRAP